MTKKMIKTLTRIGIIGGISRIDTAHRNSVIDVNIRISFTLLFWIIVTRKIIGGTDMFVISVSLQVFIATLDTIKGRLVLFVIFIILIYIFICVCVCICICVCN